ncbi:MAG: hypothetical protein V3S07_10305 [Micropepsaceae bacterium]
MAVGPRAPAHIEKNLGRELARRLIALMYQASGKHIAGGAE